MKALDLPTRGLVAARWDGDLPSNVGFVSTVWLF